MAKQIQLTKGKTAIVDDEDYERVNRHGWVVSGKRTLYAHATIGGKSVYMHRLILAAPQGAHVDHINGNTLDNRKENLRVCTRSQNSANSRKYRLQAATSKYKGVSFYTRYNKWVASIKAQGKQHFLGYFSEEKEAAIAYNRAALNLHGQFARLNQI